MNPTPAKASHLIALDGVRGLAILGVLAFHFIAHGPSAEAWPIWIQKLTAAGWIGVDLFFVLSGFLITRLLIGLRGQPRAFVVFYARRALRIFPLYYALLLFLAIYVLIASHGRPTSDEWLNQLAMWLYVTNFNIARHDWAAAIFRGVQVTHLWTLAIEEQFYLVWPAVVLLASRGLSIAACVAMICIAPAFRLWMLQHDSIPPAVYVHTLGRMDTLAWGALLAIVLSRRLVTPLVLMTLGGAAAALGMAIHLGAMNEYAPLMQFGGYSALAVCFCGFVGLAVLYNEHPRVRRVLGAWPLVRIGRLSYGMYIVHIPLRSFASAVCRVGLHRDPSSLSLPAAAVCAIALFTATYMLAEISFRSFESFFLRMKPSV